jgi:DNA-binding Xre family transcriptional regulator
MLEKEMTTVALSEKSGVSRQTLCYIRNGKRCSDVTGYKIAHALGVDVKDLIEEV